MSLSIRLGVMAVGIFLAACTSTPSHDGASQKNGNADMRNPASGCTVTGNGKTYMVQYDADKPYSMLIVTDQLGRGSMTVRDKKTSGDEYWDDNNLCVQKVNKYDGCLAYIQPNSKSVYEGEDGGLRLGLSGNQITASTGAAIATESGCTATEALLAGYAIASSMK